MLSQGYKIVFGVSARKIFDHKPSKGHRKSPGYEGPFKGSGATRGCDPGVTGRTSSGILHPCLSGKEAIWKFSSRPQLKTTKQVGDIQKISYGLNLYSQESIDTGMLHGVNRFEMRTFIFL